MTDVVFNDCRFEVNAVDYSANVKSVTMNLTRKELDAMAMGDTVQGVRMGARQIALSASVYNDVTDNGFDESMFALWDAATKVTVKVRVTTAAISAGNPEYQFTNMYVKGLSPLSGGVDEMLMNDPVFAASPETTITRAVA